MKKKQVNRQRIIELEREVEELRNKVMLKNVELDAIDEDADRIKRRVKEARC